MTRGLCTLGPILAAMVLFPAIVGDALANFTAGIIAMIPAVSYPLLSIAGSCHLAGGLCNP